MFKSCCACAGMMHSLPNGHMIAAPAPQMMATAAPAQQMRATTMPHTTQQQPASRMHGGAPWPAAPPGSRSQPTSLNGSEQGAGAAPVNGVKQEARTPPPKGRAPSGWTPVAAKKLPRNCFGPRSTKRRCGSFLTTDWPLTSWHDVLLPLRRVLTCSPVPIRVRMIQRYSHCGIQNMINT